MQLHQQFIEMAKRYPQKIAISDRTTNKDITYEKALIASIMLSKKIKKQSGGFIGIMIPTSMGCSLSILGTLMCGKVPVMINYSTGAAENAEYAQRKCGFRTIITSKALMEKIGCRYVKGMLFVEDFLSQMSLIDKIKAAATAKLPLPILLRTVHGGEMDDNATILFTSGSEKDPKAVQLTHKNINANIHTVSEIFNLGEKDIMLGSLPFFHVFGLTVNHWLPLLKGMKSVDYANPLDFKKMVEVIRDNNVNLVIGTPIFLNGYLKKSKPGDFENVRITIAGADKVPEHLRSGYMRDHDIEIFEGYGTTETSPVISVNYPDNNKPGSIGMPLPDVQVKITDLETGETLPPNQEGKILVKGDIVMKGYYDDIEETSLHIRDGWYDTGDMGALDEDGYLWHKGRLKRFVKIGGEMVSLVRVEKTLEKHLDDEIDCCVVEVPDSIKGAKIVAVLTGKVNEKKLKKTLSKELPPLFMPKEFIYLESIPKMGSGKVDFRKTTKLVMEKYM